MLKLIVEVLVTEIRHVNAAGDTIYTSRKRSMPEQQTRGRRDSEGFYRDPITATEPIHQMKRDPNTTVQYPPMTMADTMSSVAASPPTRSVPTGGMTADVTVGGAAITDTTFAGDGDGSLGSGLEKSTRIKSMRKLSFLRLQQKKNSFF